MASIALQVLFGVAEKSVLAVAQVSRIVLDICKILLFLVWINHVRFQAACPTVPGRNKAKL